MAQPALQDRQRVVGIVCVVVHEQARRPPGIGRAASATLEVAALGVPGIGEPHRRRLLIVVAGSETGELADEAGLERCRPAGSERHCLHAFAHPQVQREPFYCDHRRGRQTGTRECARAAAFEGARQLAAAERLHLAGELLRARRIHAADARAQVADVEPVAHRKASFTRAGPASGSRPRRR